MTTAKQIIERIKQGGQITDWERANVPFSSDEMIEAGLMTEKFSDKIGRMAVEAEMKGKSCFKSVRMK
ncbi:MAG: hypothetical protein RLY43_274 [Bacteroidota bacterium]|jgi:hypothetical protein